MLEWDCSYGDGCGDCSCGTGALAGPGRDGLCRCSAFGQQLPMLRLPAQQLNSMWDKRRHGLQRLHRPRRTPWQIENQCPPPHAANAPTQRGKRSLLAALAPHALRHAVEQPVTHGHSSLRCNVTCSNPSATGRHNKLDFTRQPNQQILNLNGVIRNYLAQRNGEMKLLQNLRYRRPRDILAFPASAGIADRHHGRRDVPRFSHRGGHLPLLPFGLHPRAREANSGHSQTESHSRPARLPVPVLRLHRAKIRRAAASPPSTALEY